MKALITLALAALMQCAVMAATPVDGVVCHPRQVNHSLDVSTATVCISTKGIWAEWQCDIRTNKPIRQRLAATWAAADLIGETKVRELASQSHGPADLRAFISRYGTLDPYSAPILLAVINAGALSCWTPPELPR
jgi:hypothetical protein